VAHFLLPASFSLHTDVFWSISTQNQWCYKHRHRSPGSP
jgi:hypothetical protein